MPGGKPWVQKVFCITPEIKNHQGVRTNSWGVCGSSVAKHCQLF